MNWYFFLAGLAALITFAAHTFIGGRLFAAPLLASKDLGTVVRLTNYYCWHIVTILLVPMAAAFFFASYFPRHVALAAGFTAIAAGCSLLSLFIVASYKVRPLRMPQWLFFAVVTVFGVCGLLL